ncbi:hypothetical protein BHE74_00055146 [Ensete ventricosum]|nr:hypothetical protein GW17_00030874 [Ensete ventricosum]RWW39522.1 hypothetical protein BHE74_00055146 [Ensete ventricosum]
MCISSEPSISHLPRFSCEPNTTPLSPVRFDRTTEHGGAPNHVRRLRQGTGTYPSRRSRELFWLWLESAHLIGRTTEERSPTAVVSPPASTAYSRSLPPAPPSSPSSCPAAGPTRPAHLARCTCRAVGPVGESKAKLNLIRRNVRKGRYRERERERENRKREGRGGGSTKREERARRERGWVDGVSDKEESRGRKRRDSSVFLTRILGFLSGATAAAAE